jgi:hypothetical protein
MNGLLDLVPTSKNRYRPGVKISSMGLWFRSSHPWLEEASPCALCSLALVDQGPRPIFLRRSSYISRPHTRLTSQHLTDIDTFFSSSVLTCSPPLYPLLPLPNNSTRRAQQPTKPKKRLPQESLHSFTRSKNEHTQHLQHGRGRTRARRGPFAQTREEKKRQRRTRHHYPAPPTHLLARHGPSSPPPQPPPVLRARQRGRGRPCCRLA